MFERGRAGDCVCVSASVCVLEYLCAWCFESGRERKQRECETEREKEKAKEPQAL